MIKIKDKEFSEETIANALEKQFGVKFEKPEPKWIAAINGENDRLILNLSTLSDYFIRRLQDPLQRKRCISICKNGNLGQSKILKEYGLTYYSDTKIVF